MFFAMAPLAQFFSSRFAMQGIVLFVFAQPPFPHTIIISCSSENNFGDRLYYVHKEKLLMLSWQLICGIWFSAKKGKDKAMG